MSTDASPHGPLEALADALDPRDFATTLVTGDGRVPHLHVTSRHAQFGEDIYADTQYYWWSWAERIASTDSPQAAARKIAAVLYVPGQPAHG